MNRAFPMFAVVAALLLAVEAVCAQPAPRTGSARAPAVTPKLSQATPSANAAALAQLLAGTGVTITNAALNAAATAAGTFAGGAASVGIDSGVVLSTGAVGDVLGPNDDEATTTDFARPGDPALDALVAPYTTQDAAVLEFDVTTSLNTISIRFVFASEEYNEFVDSPFNDVFAIFVNGVNCANFDGRPVSVNSINAGLNPGLYVDNTTGTRNTQMDGLTVPLQCVAAVTPNAPNRVRIAIADTSDGILDAAVFLSAGGVVSPGSGPPTTSNIVKVIEYYHAVFNHYFVTAIPAEIANLDTGALSADWDRTGQAFNVFQSGVAGTAPVCRFFSASFAPRSSHFYTPDAPECVTVKANPRWTFEAEVFNVRLPAADGSCAAGTQPLYRMYNNGMSGAPNHRYTTDLTLRSGMLAQGWVPEGAGVGIIACVPT